MQGKGQKKMKFSFLLQEVIEKKMPLLKELVQALEMVKRIFEENDCIFNIDIKDNGTHSDFIVSIEFRNR